ncbi:glycosyltransferase family 4 protein [Psychroflexus sp. YR1-1]|uniref:Glycosyltransferase family 4 protein n=1 Tax=Psychroflexus aurantiacus TaxID=2709310 RepID=A0A6B3R2K1_9FLAO|nr:glycosyltransferase family 4 protein [Psychroflexus aurantiacus]NEV94502.1 glycosyltransferase family 4 protein [Psychroflexus aurantiacus]
MKKIGIVTTWFERGAAYVSKQFEQVLQEEHEVFIYARGGEHYAIGDPEWDKSNVTWGKNIRSRFALTLMDKKDFKAWVDLNSIDLILFNEQHWFEPLLWCKEWGIQTAAYIDYYTRETIGLFNIYDLLICNTRRHYSVFENTNKAEYLPWGTDTDLFSTSNTSELVNGEHVTFFHSCGMGHKRKGTEQLIIAFSRTKHAQKLIIHTQQNISGAKIEHLISSLEAEGRLKIIHKTVPAPGLFHLGDVYLYPSLLEGIGLTIVEALSCGLATLVPDNAPMNEFVDHGFNGLLIKKGKCYLREDKYYWPLCEIDIDDLVQKIDYLATHKDKVIRMKRNARQSALNNLSLKENMKSLSGILENLEFTPLRQETENKIIKFGKKGFGRFNKLYIKLYPFINMIYRLHGYVKPSK